MGRSKRSSRPSPAMIIAVTALVLAMVGTGYAAVRLPAKSVGTKQLKANAVTTAKVKAHAITGKKLKLKSIGTVPNASHAILADTANALAAPEVHEIGAPGQPGFNAGAKNISTEGAPYTFVPASFFKDHNGVVHLEGAVEAGSSAILFVLPPGFRPGGGKVQVFPGNETEIFGSNVVLSGQDVSGAVAGGGGALLTGITFRAES